MFQILEFVEAKMAVQTRTEKHGDEDQPAVTLSLTLTTANTLLDTIDAGLRHALYKAVEGQDVLPDVEPTTPVLRANSIDRVLLTTAHEGWTLLVDDGIDETDPRTFTGCKVDKLSIEPQQGGSVILRVRVGTSDVDADSLGWLGMHNGQSVWVQIRKPEPKPDAIDGSVAAFQADHPDATDLFTESAGA